MEIAPHFITHETDHWVINHHLASALPGYLMLGTKLRTTSLTELSADALAELGGLLAKTQSIIEQQLLPKRLYIGRFGHEQGCQSTSISYRSSTGSKIYSGMTLAIGYLKILPTLNTPYLQLTALS